MEIQTYKTHKIKPNENLFLIIEQYVPKIKNKSILFITSKIVSLYQNRILKKDSIKNKKKLIQSEADYYIPNQNNKHGALLTIKNKSLSASAGIDESNSKGYYILHPINIQKTAYEIWKFVRKKMSIKELGVIITDSHLTPLRRGTTGYALGWCGIKSLIDYREKKDIFNQPLQVSCINVIDSLSTIAVFAMGEGNEQTPLATISSPFKVKFSNTPPTKEEEQSFFIDINEDIFAHILNSVAWQKNKNI